MRDLNQRILALRENYFASVEERQRCLAEAWGCVCDPETGIAVVSINGPTFASYWGPGTYSNLRATVEGLLDRDDVRCIVLEINSPGGDVNGLFECCEYISKANEAKPITAHVTGMCCSAAYAIAASCDKVVATQTSEIGSVGVYAQAYDDSEFLKKQGILARIFRSRNAERKNESPFSEEGAAEIQSKIDYYEDCFYTVLSEGRAMERERCVEDFGHGAVFLATEALERNMIDGVMSYDELMNKLASSEEEEDEGDDDMDIAQMTAEQKAELFKALVADSPSLLAEAEGAAREAERSRVTGLYALRTDDTKDIVDEAITAGKSADAIMGDLWRAEKERADRLEAEKANLDTIRKQAENDQALPGLKNPMPDDLGAQADRIAERVAKARK